MYIGKGTGCRDQFHLFNGGFFFKLLKKLRLRGFQPIIIRLHDNLEEQEAYKIESELINKFGTRFDNSGILFNVSKEMGISASGYRGNSKERFISNYGAVEGLKRWNEFRDKISKLHSGKVISEDTKKRMGKSGAKNGNYGNKMSLESRDKIAEFRRSTRGKYTRSEETKRKMSENHRSKSLNRVSL
jgi:hypothetical protein